MTTLESKILKVISVLYSYCVYIGGTDITIHCERAHDSFNLIVRSDFTKGHEKMVKRLVKQLNTAKNPAVEELYWQGIGLGRIEDENDIYIVGSMINNAELEIEDNYFTLSITRFSSE